MYACRVSPLRAEIFNGNLRQILSMFYALSRFKQRVIGLQAGGSPVPVTSAVTNGNHVVASSGGSRDLHSHVTDR